MSDLPPYHALATVDTGLIRGLITEYGATAQAADHQFAWERDHALPGAVDEALRDAAEGKQAESRRRHAGWTG